jgi:hypothetical protein
MGYAVNIEALKKEHDTLYEEAVREHPALLKDDSELQKFVSKVDSFLEDLTRLGSEVKSLQDFRWLSDASIKWQLVLSSILNIPRNIEVVPMPESLETPSAQHLLTDEQLENLLKERALRQSLIRKAGILLKKADLLLNVFPSTREEMEQDWRSASTVVAAEVLEGRLDFVRSFSPASYFRLESEWLTDVKRTKAYFVWLERLSGEASSGHTSDYYEACRRLRNQLLNPQIKGSVEEFQLAKDYLDQRYLVDGKLDPGKSQEMLARKAHRIYETTGETDAKTNWEHASTYARMFYEHIIPAVEEPDEESTLMVLKAFQYSKAQENRFLVVNAFETALAIYFLDPEMIEKVKSAPDAGQEPYSVSSVTLAAWLAGWSVPAELADRLTFDREQALLSWQGVMTNADKERLKESLPSSLAGAVDQLYRESRLLPWESII